MTTERLWELALDRRFGDGLTYGIDPLPTNPVDVEELTRLEAELDALCSAARDGAFPVDSRFTASLAARIDSEAVIESSAHRRRWLGRALAAYAGIAAGALFFVMVHGLSESEPTPLRADHAALDFGGDSGVSAVSRPRGR